MDFYLAADRLNDNLSRLEMTVSLVNPLKIGTSEYFENMELIAKKQHGFIH